MAVISDQQIATVAGSQFGDLGSSAVILMTAIALAESSGDAAALSPGAKSGGSGAYGLWQIQNNHTDTLGASFYQPGGYDNPVKNGAAARLIYNSQGISAWSAYTNGSYAQFLPRAQAAVTATKDLPAAKPVYVGGFPSSNGAADFFDKILQLNSAGPGVPGGWGSISPDFGANGGQGYPDSVGGILTGNNNLNFLSGLGPVLWIAGGTACLALGIVMLAKNEVNPIALAGKVLG